MERKASGGKKKKGYDPFERSKHVECSFSGEAHLARCTMEKYNLLEEMSRIRGQEDIKFRGTLAVKEPPSTVKLRGAPFAGGTNAEKQLEQLTRKTKSATDLRRSPSTAAPSEASTKKKEGANPAFKNFMYFDFDPTDKPNEHGPRAECIQQLIDVQERKVNESKRIQAHRAAEPGATEMPPPSFAYDRAPPGEGLSEAQAHYFPRSAANVKECGGGRDQRFVRPFDDFYRFRESFSRFGGFKKV